MTIEAMKQALEALEYPLNTSNKSFNVDMAELLAHRAITSLRQAISEAEKQEPVAMQMDVIVVNLVREGINKHRARELAEHFIKHTSPPQRQPLSDEQINTIWHNSNPTNFEARSFARAIEAAHGIKGEA